MFVPTLSLSLSPLRPSARSVFTAFAVLALALVTGCAAESSEPVPEAEDVEVASQDVVSGKEPAIDVTARYRLVYADTPTYGYEPKAALLDIDVVVDDARLAKSLPGFDGYERAFALVPRTRDGRVVFERVELAYRGQSVRGYIALRFVDRHGVEGLRLGEQEVPALRESGIAIGLETNRGTVWAQEPGKNFAAEKVGGL